MSKKCGLPLHLREEVTLALNLWTESQLQLCRAMHIYAHETICSLKINKQDLSKQKSLTNTQGYQENCSQDRELFSIIYRLIDLSTKMTCFR
jgi:hypothetical protein